MAFVVLPCLNSNTGTDTNISTNGSDTAIVYSGMTFALARHAAAAKSPPGSDRIYFKHTLKESQFVETVTLSGGWMNLEAVFRYQDRIESQLTALARASRFLKRCGFEGFFPI